MNIRLNLIFSFGLIAIFFLSPYVAFAKNIALVIGNNDYTESPLRNPENDARGIAEVLEKLNFKVTVVLNADRKELKNSIRYFSKSLKADDTGFIYYSGHGVERLGKNYLIPVASDIQSGADLEYEAIDLGFMLDNVENAQNDFNIIVLDACRNNPFKGFRSSTKGLARTKGADGMLIAYSTSPGDVALDGSNHNSPYAQYLMKYMQVKGLAIESMFKKVRKAVKDETAGFQAPWYESSIEGEFSFSGHISTTPDELPDTAIGCEAFVVGNFDYRSYKVEKHEQYRNDYIDLQTVLRRLGFTVNSLENPNRREMMKFISSYGESLQNNKISLLYYNGLGLQLNGGNYLVPVDSKIDDMYSLEYEAIDLSRVFDYVRMDKQPSSASLVIVDAARSVSMYTRGISQGGLARISDSPQNSLTVFTTPPGEVIKVNNDWRNGYFMKYFLEHAQNPKLSIQRMIDKTQDNMKEVGADIYYFGSGIENILQECSN